MTDELLAFETNQTWDLVPKPSGVPVIGKWVYSVKLKSDGSLDQSKGHLVAQGFKQDYVTDYEETLAPVAKLTTVRMGLD